MTEPHRGRSLALWAQEAEAAAGIARSLAGTAFIPDSLRVRDDRNVIDLDATVAQVAAALLTGQELGFDPMASLRSIDVIPPGSGSPALRANALRGLLQQHGHDIEVTESTATRAIVTGSRFGTGPPQVSTWTLDRAKRLGPRGFNDPKGSWQRQPSVMLVARATAECARWIASDVLLGLPYLDIELEDGAGSEPVSDDGEPGSGATPPAPPVRRRTARRPVRPGSAAPLALPAATPGADAGAGDEAAPAADPPPRLSGQQRARLWAGLKRLGLVDKDDALKAVSGWVGRQVTSSNDLSADEASTALSAIDAEQLRRDARQAAEDAQAAAEASQGEPDLPPEPEAGPDE